MSTRTAIAALIWMMVNAVLFGAGAVAVLSIPQLNANAMLWLPVVIAASFLLSPLIAWQIAPTLRARWQRTHVRPTP
ncbi:MAG: hypothetical protein WC829_10385 [Hyphomicrobium sp.]|jgi:hypothetical protein